MTLNCGRTKLSELKPIEYSEASERIKESEANSINWACTRSTLANTWCFFEVQNSKSGIRSEIFTIIQVSIKFFYILIMFSRREKLKKYFSHFGRRSETAVLITSLSTNPSVRLPVRHVSHHCVCNKPFDLFRCKNNPCVTVNLHVNASGGRLHLLIATRNQYSHNNYRSVIQIFARTCLFYNSWEGAVAV